MAATGVNGAAPLVSVVIPCFNARRWIEATIASVEAQTWRPLEIVVVDDGSSDGSGEWLQAQAEAGRIALLRQPNTGQGSAFNAGVRLSRGSLLQFLDADDLLHPRKIEHQVTRLAGRSDLVATAAWGRFFGVDPAEVKPVEEPCWRDLPPLDWLAAAWHDGGGMMFPALWLVPREVVVAAGPWASDLDMNIDGEYFTRIVLASRGVRFCGESLACYRSAVPGSMSSRTDAMAFDAHHRALQRINASLDAHLGHAGVRRGLSLVWQRYARFAHPHAPALAEDALRRAANLDPARLPIEGGWRTRVVSALFGWRVARRLQVWRGRP